MARAFDKLCAPGNDEIGPYDFVDDCNWPPPPDPITSPTDPPIPIPPVDQGCFPFNITGKLFAIVLENVVSVHPFLLLEFQEGDGKLESHYRR